jgi:hypothetical protein
VISPAMLIAAAYLSIDRYSGLTVFITTERAAVRRGRGRARRVDCYRHVPIAGLIRRYQYAVSSLKLLIPRVITAFRYQLGCAFVSWKLLHRVTEIVFVRHCMPRRLSCAAHRPALYLARCGLLDHNYRRVRVAPACCSLN